MRKQRRLLWLGAVIDPAPDLLAAAPSGCAAQLARFEPLAFSNPVVAAAAACGEKAHQFVQVWFLHRLRVSFQDLVRVVIQASADLKGRAKATTVRRVDVHASGREADGVLRGHGHDTRAVDLRAIERERVCVVLAKQVEEPLHLCQVELLQYPDVGVDMRPALNVAEVRSHHLVAELIGLGIVQQHYRQMARPYVACKVLEGLRQQLNLLVLHWKSDSFFPCEGLSQTTLTSKGSSKTRTGVLQNRDSPGFGKSGKPGLSRF